MRIFESGDCMPLSTIPGPCKAVLGLFLALIKDIALPLHGCERVQLTGVYI
jgi:hypothetical protein